MAKTTDEMHLVQFTVKNYRSIREPVTLSMIASPKHEGFDTFTPRIIKRPLLRTAALFGANASGKSNVLRALFLMKQCTVGDENIFDMKEKFKPFAFDGESRNYNTSFEVIFEYNRRLIVHGFEVNTKQRKIMREWLKFSDHKHPRLTQVFERELDHVRLSTNLSVSEHGISRSYTKQVSPYTLFVNSVSKLSNSTLAHDVVEGWKDCQIMHTLFSDPLPQLSQLIYEKPEVKDLLLPLLREADLHISTLKVEKKDDAYNLLVGHAVKSKDGKSRDVMLDLFQDESDGTRKFLSFAIHVLFSLRTGTPIVLDELGSALHPRLLHFIIRLYKDKKRNPHNAQLIITAHDTTLLKKLLSRDQIYFTHKGSSQATELYALSDFKGIRKNLSNIDERYLRGDFGAIPEIDEEV